MYELAAEKGKQPMDDSDGKCDSDTESDLGSFLKSDSDYEGK